MSDVLEQVDVESIEHLDFEAQCAVKDCEAAARFSVVCRFCADVTLACEGHTRNLIALNQTLFGFQCEACHHIEFDLWALVCIHPLKP
ncbi:hypothetical protein [Rathayibacter sp. VKM Ac-2630]|uniref:hypothetical protein n=1 Tax=Rathayibacter sp. VKM Ac-2630 TaxID=1938617 RepID=UPI000980F3FA|nr:hypothetical protein [Rathayibacter sp. VKM Ac-2630]OOB90714.1 hypothetical protein B0T42_09910 [Rathayibacter sp. VKM Ac-2630]